MNKYILKVSVGEANTAGPKAKEDIAQILLESDFKQVDINLSKSKFRKLFLSKGEVKKGLNELEENDIFIFQYPIYSRYITNLILSECKKKKIKVIGLIHDIEALRLFKDDEKNISKELEFLKKFDVLIAHNKIMEVWLREQKLMQPIVSLNIFDYLNENDFVKTKNESNLLFAGNLQKSEFLEEWNIKEKITLFGINPSKYASKYVEYRGVKTPGELPKYLDGSFGLVWDGTSMSTNNGVYGEYTRYNNPHKVSLYLSSGLPVIVWNEAAIAKFIEKNKLGIVVGSLYDLEDKLEKLSNQDYEQIVANVLAIGNKMRNGYFTKRAINEAIDLI